MKNWLIASNVILIVLVAVLFFLHYNSGKTKSGVTGTSVNQSSASENNFKIAYFEMDSLENNFEMVREMKNELNKKEEAITNELGRMERQYRDKANEYQSKAETMTQAQGEMASRDMMQMQQNMQSRKQSLEQEYQDFVMRKTREIKTKIEEFLEEYNKEKGYSYIVAYEPGLFYYRDTLYNITGDVLKGLNELSKSPKK